MTILDSAITGMLMRMLEPGDFGRIVESFGQDVLRLTSQMEAGVRAGDHRAVHCAAHALAGAAASVGAVALERAARRGLGRESLPQDLVPAVRAAGIEAVRELRALLQPADPV